ncbi:MAG: AEC family transporter [Bacillota bacterium]
MKLLEAMLGTVLPVFLLAGLGYLARTVLKADVKDPAKLAIYLMTPGLLMNSVLTSQLGAGEVGTIVAFVLLLTAAMIGITLGVARLLGWRPVEGNAAVLSTGFMNAANYGLPVVLLAFGQAGFDRAAIFVVVESILMYSVAVFFAARGRMDWRQAVVSVFKLPLIWAAGFALTMRLLGIALPDFLMKPIGLLADGAIVLVVILLGMQVASIRLRGSLPKIGVAVLIRLVLSPLVALALVAWLKPDPLTAKVLVLESAMPAAVNTTLLAVQFDAEPDQVSGVTLASTLLSLATVSFWVWFLQP